MQNETNTPEPRFRRLPSRHMPGTALSSYTSAAPNTGTVASGGGSGILPLIAAGVAALIAIIALVVAISASSQTADMSAAMLATEEVTAEVTATLTATNMSDDEISGTLRATERLEFVLGFVESLATLNAQPSALPTNTPVPPATDTPTEAPTATTTPETPVADAQTAADQGGDPTLNAIATNQAPESVGSDAAVSSPEASQEPEASRFGEGGVFLITLSPLIPARAIRSDPINNSCKLADYNISQELTIDARIAPNETNTDGRWWLRFVRATLPEGVNSNLRSAAQMEPNCRSQDYIYVRDAQNNRFGFTDEEWNAIPMDGTELASPPTAIPTQAPTITPTPTVEPVQPDVQPPGETVP